MADIGLEQLLIERAIAKPQNFKASLKRLKNRFGLSSDADIDMETIIRAYCLTHYPNEVLDHLGGDFEDLAEVAELLGLSNYPYARRADLIDLIISQGLGIRELNVSGLSNRHRLVTGFKKRFFQSKAKQNRSRVEELITAGIKSSAVIEQTLKDIFALNTQLIFPALSITDRKPFWGIEKDKYKFQTVIDKIRNLNTKVIPNNPTLEEILHSNFGRTFIAQDKTLECAREVFRLRSTELAHDATTQSWNEIAPIVESILDLGAEFLQDAIGHKLLPAMIVQIQYIKDEWGREYIYFLHEDDFDADGSPDKNSGKFDQQSQVLLDECFVMTGGAKLFRPRVPCYCIPDNFTLPVVNPVKLLFVDQVRQFPLESGDT